MHQLDDLALKSPTATTQKGLFSVTTFKFKFKSSRNESNYQLFDWVTDKEK